MIHSKRYRSPEKTLMYRVVTDKNDFVKHVQLDGPDAVTIFSADIDSKKTKVKFSKLKKEHTLEQIVFMLYYPAVLEKVFKKVDTSDLTRMMGVLGIKNPYLLHATLETRRTLEKAKWAKSLAK